jgi:hypothetical protein
MTTALHPQVTQGTLDLAMSLLHDELEKMLCVAICLVNKLQPKNTSDIQDDEDLIAWRLAQVLEDRLSETAFEDSLRELLHVKSTKESQITFAKGAAV